jgi:hypothetical protein
MPATLALPLLLLAQQPQIAERLAGRVSPDIASVAIELGNGAAARGLPLDPLVQKAIEGSAKGIPADRVAQALRAVVAQLDSAAVALRAGRAELARDTVAIAAGAFAISAGLRGRDLMELARSGGRARTAETIVGLRVAGTLVALGVPAEASVNLVSASLRADRPAGELLSLPAQVQEQIARGVPAAQAAAGLARAAAAQARRGPPPGRGQPPPRPPPPPHP